jgi:hypothetical protein
LAGDGICFVFSIFLNIPCMKLASALEGGLAGATTISLIGETLRKIDGKPSGGQVISGKKLKKRFRKASSKKPMQATKQYIQLAGDLLGSTAFLGFSSLTKKKNAMLRGALLGTAAGLGAVFLNDLTHDKKTDHTNGHEGFPSTMQATDSHLQKLLEVGLFTLGGLIAGKLVQSTGKKKRRKK